MVLANVSFLAGAAKSSVVTASFALLQDAPSTVSHGNSILLEIFVGMAAVSMFVVALVVLVIAIEAKRAKDEAMGYVRELRAKVMPLIASSQGLVTDLTPEIKQITTKVNEITGKVNVITGHVGEIVVVAKEKIDEFSPTISDANQTFRGAVDKAKVTFDQGNATVQGVNERARAQVDRVNDMVTGALDATNRLGKAIEHAITVPGRELAGLLSGAKASLESLTHNSSFGLNGLVGKVASAFAGSKKGYQQARGADYTRRGTQTHSAGTQQARTVADEPDFGSARYGAGGPGVPSGRDNDPIL